LDRDEVNYIVMNEPIDAIYENGILRPVVPLSLPDKTRVKITLEAQPTIPVAVEPQDEWERRLLELATDCGVSLSNAAVSSEGLYE
jgi:predicted DNA-binding antitoxin AbrB/MazE fold protein